VAILISTISRECTMPPNTQTSCKERRLKNKF
jgi:hypothetical protein